MRVKILKALTIIASIIFLVSVSCLDNGFWWPCITGGISAAWLLLMTIANMPKGDYYGPRKNF